MSGPGFDAARKNRPPNVAQRLLDLDDMSLYPEITGAGDFAATAVIIE